MISKVLLANHIDNIVTNKDNINNGYYISVNSKYYFGYKISQINDELHSTFRHKVQLSIIYNNQWLDFLLVFVSELYSV